MKIVDANVLIYSVDETSAHHLAARTWMDDALSNAEPIMLPWLCLLAFVRLTTHRGLNDNPLSVDGAFDRVDAWLAAPPVITTVDTASASQQTRRLLVETGGSASLVNDAWLAALAYTNDADLVSFDADFARFAGLRWVSPPPAP